jgi:carboxymethylenebutenolidase
MTPTHTETIPLVDETQLRVTVGEPDGALRGGVVVLHESRGMTSRTEAIVEALSGEGWLAVAPHLYHRDDPGIDEQTGEDEVVDRAAAAISGESILADSDAAFGMLADRGVPSDRMAVLGFDLGATAALVVAAQRSLGAVITVSAGGVAKPLSAGLPALVDVVGELTCPWLGLYGDRGDPVDPADVDLLRAAAHASGRVVDVVVYPQREHRFDADEQAAVQPDPLDEGNSEEATKMEARSRVLNWLDAHLR